MLPSVNVPVAVNCWASPSGTDGIAGVTAIETRAACVTLQFVDPTIEPEVALIVVEPTALLLACPDAPIVATVVLDELHSTEADRSCVLPSV